ncbi:hypothetical protein OROHE_020524 [Orobanche hederae]
MDPSTSKSIKVDYKEDMLSDLPDDVLSGILSHMQLKEVARSGIL